MIYFGFYILFGICLHMYILYDETLQSYDVQETNTSFKLKALCVTCVLFFPVLCFVFTLRLMYRFIKEMIVKES